MSVNVKAIFVEELPEFCHECQYAKRVPDPDGKYQGWECVINSCTILPEELFEKLPDWCRMRNIDQVFDKIFFREKATPHINTVLEKAVRKAYK